MGTSLQIQKQQKIIRYYLVFFIIALILSGLTAFPLETELALIVEYSTYLPETLKNYLTQIYLALVETNSKYPFLAYGTDWLAFAHIVIAIAFIGPLLNPIKNIWVVEFGMIACILVIPLAMIAGSIRGIPLYWRLIDCSFGVFGIIPLYFCRLAIKKLEIFTNSNQVTS